MGPRSRLFGPERICVGSHFTGGEYTQLQTWGQGRLTIGDKVSLQSNCQLSAALEITVGSGVLFGDNVFVTDNLHGAGRPEELGIPPLEREIYAKGPVHIGDNVWLGRNVVVMPGVTIGDGAIIGANAVVTHDVPAGAKAAGVPAKVLKGE